MGEVKRRKAEMSVEKMGRKGTNITDFSTVPFLAATEVEKEGERKGNF